MVRRSGGLLAAGMLLGCGTASAVMPIDSGAIPGSVPVAIAASSDREVGVYVDGDVATYMRTVFTPTAGISVVRVYDFASGATNDVPLPSGASGAAFGISGSRIVLQYLVPPSNARGKLDVYDFASNALTTVNADMTLFTSAAIGGDTVAYVTVEPGIALHVASIAAGTESIVASGLTSLPFVLSVAPAGDAIIWNDCSGGICGVYKASRSGSSWTVSPVSVTSENAVVGDMDGTTIVYQCDRGGERDICWQPVGGGVEMRLELPGAQDYPAVSNGTIVFRSRSVSGGPTDILLYEMSTNRLFHVTDTPDVEDWPPDITTLAGGQQRVVWTTVPLVGGVPDDSLADVNGVTFTLPLPPPPNFGFGGFQQPVDPLPALNTMKAGGAVPVKFTLGGFKGLGIFAAGYPKSQEIACDSTALETGIEQTVSAGGSSLGYDASTDTYTYIWKTNKSWAGTCRQFVLGLSDGTFYRANFKFK